MKAKCLADNDNQNTRIPADNKNTRIPADFLKPGKSNIIKNKLDKPTNYLREKGDIELKIL